MDIEAKRWQSKALGAVQVSIIFILAKNCKLFDFLYGKLLLQWLKKNSDVFWLKGSKPWSEKIRMLLDYCSSTNKTDDKDNKA